MDKTITTVLLIIAGVVCSVFLFNTVYPMINRSSAAMVSMSEKIDDRMKSQVDIVHAAASSDKKTVYVWIKNVGSSRITAVDQSDVFFGPDGNFLRVSYYKNNDGSLIDSPYWSFDIENDPDNNDEWKIGETVKITLTYSEALDSDTYYVKIVIPNGIAAEYYFSM